MGTHSNNCRLLKISETFKDHRPSRKVFFFMVSFRTPSKNHRTLKTSGISLKICSLDRSLPSDFLKNLNSPWNFLRDLQTFLTVNILGTSLDILVIHSNITEAFSKHCWIFSKTTSTLSVNSTVANTMSCTKLYLEMLALHYDSKWCIQYVGTKPTTTHQNDKMELNTWYILVICSFHHYYHSWNWICAGTDNTCNILHLNEAFRDSSDYLSRWERWARSCG